MTGTDSGLLQSLTQGPIDADIVKLCEVLFADQADNTARKNLANQKLGDLTESALYYLIYKNISGQAPQDGPGVRLSTGTLAKETPHLNKLMALLIKNGASASNVFKDHTDEEIAMVSLVLDRLLDNNDIEIFAALFPAGQTIDREHKMAFFEWIAKSQHPGRFGIIKSILSNNSFEAYFKKSAKTAPVMLALILDLKSVVMLHPPVKTGGLLGGILGGEYKYTGAVALQKFNSLLENDLGIKEHLTDLDFEYEGNTGPLIAHLIDKATNRIIPIERRKAFTLTIAEKLKHLTNNPDSWKNLLSTQLLTLRAEGFDPVPYLSAIGIVQDVFGLSEKEAKKLLLY